MAADADTIWLHASATLCLVLYVAIVIATYGFFERSLSFQGSPSEDVIWDGGEIVQAIRQRAQTASMYISGFNYSLAIMTLGPALQAGLAYRQTKKAGTAVRTFFQVELAYQAMRSHLQANKSNDLNAEIEQSGRNRHAVDVARLGTCGIYFYWGCLGNMATFLSVLQRPLRNTVVGRDLVTLWSVLGALCTIYIGVVVAMHLGTAEWSVWHVHTAAGRPRASSSAEQTSSDSEQLTPRSDPASISQLPADLYKMHIGRSFFRALACALSVLAHMAFYVLISLSLRPRVIAVLAGHWLFSSLAYYAVSRDAMQSMIWGYLSFIMHVGFNRTTHRKAWWVGLITSIVFASAAISCGVLQTIQDTFTMQYSSAEYTRGAESHEHVPLEQSIGIAAAALFAADMVVHLTVVLTHMQRDVRRYEAEVQMPSIAC